VRELSWKKNVAEEPPRPSSFRDEDFFKPVQKVELRRGLKIGIYGEPECGKSYFGMTCPEPVYIIDTELAAVKLAKGSQTLPVHLLSPPPSVLSVSCASR